jgi:T5SS/PEP-CTERM-associated repeat protein/autotransporter-associated beta strand protein
LDADFVFDAAHGLQSSISFGSGGTLTVTQAATNSLGVGYKGNGTLRMTEGVNITSYDSYLGYFSGSSGTATVTGVDSKWNCSGLYVGYSGTGTLTIEQGGLVNNAYNGFIGYNPGSSGTTTVRGANTNWTNYGLRVGHNGSGTLNIEAGGQVSNTSGYLGYYAGSSGTVTVTGDGSKWTNSNALYIGNEGNGTLNIEAGGQVSNTDGSLGHNSGSSGTVTVAGVDSKWTCSGFFVGFRGTGTLTIEQGGLVVSNSCHIGLSSGSSGKASINGAGSKWTNSGELRIGVTGSGTLNIGDGIVSNCVVSAKTVMLAELNSATAICTLNGGMLQSSSITKGTGTATFNWSDGTIQNYNTSTNLTISGSNAFSLLLAATGTHAFNIDAGRTGMVSAILSDATSGGTLEKQGGGLLILKAANTYSGTTTIEEGQLKLVAGGDIAFSSEIINRAGFIIDGGNHAVQKITGSGTTQVLTGSLTASSIVQDTLTIGGPANAVPEPATIVLLAVATLAMFVWRRKSRVGQA